MPTNPNVVGPNNVVACCVRLHGPLLNNRQNRFQLDGKQYNQASLHCFYDCIKVSVPPLNDTFMFLKGLKSVGYFPLLKIRVFFVISCFRVDYQQLVYSALSYQNQPIILLTPCIIKPHMLWSGKQVGFTKVFMQKQQLQIINGVSFNN